MYLDVARERNRDALNAVRRLAIYHDDVLSAQLHSVTLAVVDHVKAASSSIWRSLIISLLFTRTKIWVLKFLLCFSSSSSLIVSRTRLSTVGEWAFPVGAARVWNSLPEQATSVAVFRSSLETRLFSVSYRTSKTSNISYSACAVTFVAFDTLIIHVTYYLLTFIFYILLDDSCNKTLFIVFIV